MTDLAQLFEGGTNGTGVTTGNSGTAPSNAFDATNIGTTGTVTYDNTHAAHGLLSANFQIGASAGSAVLEWTTSMGSQTKVWFRMYCYFTANPSGSTLRILRTQTSGAALCGAIGINTSGKIVGIDGGGTTRITSTNSIPLNQWFRIEGFINNSASAGQVEFKLFSSMDSTSPDETQTSGSTLNTTGTAALYLFGSSGITNVGPYWMDDLGLSSSAYIGPLIKSVSDSGTGSESIAPVNKVAEADSGTSSQAISVHPAVPLADTGTGSSSISVAVHVPLAQSGSCTETLSGGSHSPKPLSDTGTATEALHIGDHVPVADSGSATESVAVTLGSINHVGAALGFGTTGDMTVSQFEAVVGSNRYAQGHFFFQGTIPASLAAAPDGLAAYAGVHRAMVDFELTHYGIGGSPAAGAVTDRNNLATFIADCQANGLDLRICLWHEPYSSFNVYGDQADNNTDYVNSLTYYGAVLREYGIPIYFDPSNYSANHHTAVVIGTSSAPGLGWAACAAGVVDAVYSDFYVNEGNSGSTPAGSGIQGTLDNCANLADAFGLPFGLLEMGFAPATNSVNWNETDIVAYCSYVKSFFQARLAAGKKICDVIAWATNDNATQAGMYLASGWSANTIATYQWFFDTFDSHAKSISLADTGTCSDTLIAGLYPVLLGTPYAIGHAASSASSNTLTIPVSHATAEGDGIIVGASVNSLTSVPTGCSDTQGNHYDMFPNHSGDKYDAAMFLATKGPGGRGPTKPLSTSDSFAVTYSLTNTSVKNGGAIGCTGVLQINPVDQVPTPAVNVSGSTTPEVISGAVLQPGELAVSWLDNGNGGGAVSWGTGWSNLIPGFNTGTDHYSSMAAMVAAAGSVTAVGAIPSAPWAIMLMTLFAGKLAVPGIDSGTGTDAIKVTAHVPLADSGTGSSSIKLAVLAETGTGTDQVAVGAVAVHLTDSGTCTENDVVAPSEPILRFGQTYTSGGSPGAINVPVPAGLQVGDSVAIWCVVEGDDTATWMPPDGTWTTEAAVQTAGISSIQLLHKVATSADFALRGTGSWTITPSTSNPWTCGLAVVNGAAVASPFDGTPVSSGVSDTSSDTNISSASLPLVSASDLLVWMGATRSTVNGGVPQGITVPGGYTQAGSQSNSSGASTPNVGIAVASIVGAVAGATGAVVGTVSVAALGSALLLAFKPAPAATPALSQSGSCTDTLAVHLTSGVADTAVGTELIIAPTIQSIAGAPTQSGFTVVSKVPGATSLRLLVSTSPTMSPVVAAVSAQVPDSYSYVRHQVTGLQPYTVYYYQLADTPSGGSEQATGPVGSIKTLYAAGSPASFRVALASGISQAAGDPSAMLDWVEWDPDLAIITGDLDESNTTSTSVATQIGIYETQLKAALGLLGLVHNGFGYYCRGGGEAGAADADSSTYTVTNIAAYQEVFPYGTLGDQTNNPPHGLYQSWVVGRVRFIMLDVKNTDRSPGANTDNSSKTMLGALQLAWLEAQLMGPEPLKVIISNVPWAGTKSNTPGDKWWSYDTERAAILSYISSHAVRNVMLWHGDDDLVGTITPTDNASYGGFPVYCAAPLHGTGGGLNTGTFSQFYDNSGGACRQYGRITITDNGSTIAVNFVGWDATNKVARITQTDTFFAPAQSDVGTCSESLGISSSTAFGETLTVTDDVVFVDGGLGNDSFSVTSRQVNVIDVGSGVDSVIHALRITLADAGSGNDLVIAGTAKFLADSGAG